MHHNKLYVCVKIARKQEARIARCLWSNTIRLIVTTTHLVERWQVASSIRYERGWPSVFLYTQCTIPLITSESCHEIHSICSLHKHAAITVIHRAWKKRKWTYRRAKRTSYYVSSFYCYIAQLNPGKIERRFQGLSFLLVPWRKRGRPGLSCSKHG